MNVLDLILIILLFLSFLTGFWRGLIKSLGAFVGLIVGIFIAGVFYVDLAIWISEYLSWSDKILNVIAYIVILIITAKVVDIIFILLDKIFKFFAVIPFLKTINRLAGGAFGLLQGAIFLGLGIFVYSKYAFWGLFDTQIIESQIAPMLIFLIKFLLLLLPEDLRDLEGLL